MQEPPKSPPPEPVGKRIARLRAKLGWTQQELASRLAISRVAVSHIEMDLTIPSERTVTLLAGLFKLTPYELVEDTTYPLAKTERLPAIVCSYTSLEMELALMDNDLSWLVRLQGDLSLERQVAAIHRKWVSQLSRWARRCTDERQRDIIGAAQNRLEAACTRARQRLQVRVVQK